MSGGYGISSIGVIVLAVIVGYILKSRKERTKHNEVTDAEIEALHELDGSRRRRDVSLAAIESKRVSARAGKLRDKLKDVLFGTYR